MKSKAPHATNCMNSYFQMHTEVLLENSNWPPGEGRAEGDEKSKQNKPEQYSGHQRYTRTSDCWKPLHCESFLNCRKALITSSTSHLKSYDLFKDFSEYQQSYVILFVLTPVVIVNTHLFIDVLLCMVGRPQTVIALNIWTYFKVQTLS